MDSTTHNFLSVHNRNEGFLPDVFETESSSSNYQQMSSWDQQSMMAALDVKRFQSSTKARSSRMTKNEYLQPSNSSTPERRVIIPTVLPPIHRQHVTKPRKTDFTLRREIIHTPMSEIRKSRYLRMPDVYLTV